MTTPQLPRHRDPADYELIAGDTEDASSLVASLARARDAIMILCGNAGRGLLTRTGQVSAFARLAAGADRPVLIVPASV